MPDPITSVRGVPLTSQVFMSRSTGKSVDELEHLKLCILDILTTPIGSRVMRRTYGSDVFFLLDRPVNRSTLLSIYAATARALGKWEPRFLMSKVEGNIDGLAEGKILLAVEGWYLIQGKIIRLDHLTLDFYKDSRYQNPGILV